MPKMLTNNTKDFLVTLKLVQVVSNEERKKKGLNRLGKGYFLAFRLNPCNPMSYVFLTIVIPILIVMHGLVGTFQKWENPFRWS